MEDTGKMQVARNGRWWTGAVSEELARHRDLKRRSWSLAADNIVPILGAKRGAMDMGGSRRKLKHG